MGGVTLTLRAKEHGVRVHYPPPLDVKKYFIAKLSTWCEIIAEGFGGAIPPPSSGQGGKSACFNAKR